MACPEDVQTSKQRAIMNAEVADIYQRYVSDLLKSEQAAVDAITKHMMEIHAQMEDGRKVREELQEAISRNIDEGNSREVAGENLELSLLDLGDSLMKIAWRELSKAREAAEERMRDLERERSQVVMAYWANIFEYAKVLEGEPGSSRTSG